MASVYKKTVTKPLPKGAETYNRKGEQFARWKDGKGKAQMAKLTIGRDGTPRIVIETGTFYAKFRAQARKRGEQTGLDTLVVHALNDVN